MTRVEANKAIFEPHGYNITTSGGLYRIGGKKIGICYFEWTTQQLQQINILASSLADPQTKEVQTLCLLHDIRIKVLENS